MTQEIQQFAQTSGYDKTTFLILQALVFAGQTQLSRHIVLT